MAVILTADPNPFEVDDIISFDSTSPVPLDFDNGNWATGSGSIVYLPQEMVITDGGATLTLGVLTGSSVLEGDTQRVITQYDSGLFHASYYAIDTSFAGSEAIIIRATPATITYEIIIVEAGVATSIVPLDPAVYAEVGDLLDVLITFGDNQITIDTVVLRDDLTIVVDDINVLPFANASRDSLTLCAGAFNGRLTVPTYRHNATIYGYSIWALKKETVTEYSGTTRTGIVSQDHTAVLADDNTDWVMSVDGVDSNTVNLELFVEPSSEFITFTTDSDTQFQVQAVSFKPDITINYKLVQLSKGTYTSIDRGATTDRYSTTLVISGSLSYIESLIRELTLLRSAKKSVLIYSPYVNIFGDNVDYSSDISTVIGFFGKQKTVQLGKQEITVEFIATDLSFVGVDTFPNALQCLQNTWSGYAKWNTKVNETYNRDNYFVDREKDEYHFTGRYIMTIEENQKMLNFWKNTRGVQFAINDDTFGAVNMFGATMTGDGNVIIKDYKYSILSPTHRAVTIELVKVG